MQSKLCEILLEALEKCSCLLPKNIKFILRKKTNREALVGEISYIVKNPIGNLREIRDDYSLCPGSVSLGHVPSQTAHVYRYPLLHLLFCLHRETVTTFYFLGCLQDSETVMADLALSGVVFKQ